MTKYIFSPIWKKLILVCVLFNFAYTSFFPFEAIYLTGLGYGSADIAALSMATALGNFLFPFAISGLLSRQKSAGELFAAFLGLSIPLGFLLMVFHQSITIAILSVFPVTLLEFACIGQLDSYILSLGKTHTEVEYSVTRVFGNLAGAVAAFFLGNLYLRMGMDTMFLIHGAFLAVAFFLLLAMRKNIPETVVVPEADIEISVSGAELKKIYAAYMPVIIGGSMIFLGWRAMFVYLPLMIRAAGGNSSHYGYTFAIINISSMVLMYFYPRIRQRISVKKSVLIGSFVMACRWILTACSVSLQEIIIIQVLDSLSYGLTQPAIIELICQKTKVSDRSQLLAIWTGTQMALGTIIANVIVQLVSPYLGLQRTFFVFAFFAVLGCGVMMTGWRRGAVKK